MVSRRAAVLAMMLAALPAAACAAKGETWSRFKADHIAADGRVIDDRNGAISHTEGQGWTLLLAESQGDRKTFERVWSWTNATLSRQDVRLFTWRYDPKSPSPIADPNNATDGDIFIAWALLRAGQRWKDTGYLKASADIRTAIAQRLVVQVGGRVLLLPGLNGFASAGGVVYNPSYFVLPALQAFAKADPAGPWTTVIAGGLEVSQKAAFGPSGLPTDWVWVGVDGQVLPAPGKAPLFGFDAVRAPFYLAWGGEAGQQQPQNAARFWRGYYDAGKRPPAWIDVTTGQVAPYALSAGGDALASVVLADDKVRRAPADEDRSYYPAVLQLLGDLAAKESRRR